MLQGIEEMREAWRQRAEADAKRQRAKEERDAEADAIWGEQRRQWQATTDAMFGRPKPTNEQLKEA